MAAFIAKQVVGKQFESVKGALGDKEDKEEKEKKGSGDDDDDDEEDAVAEARREEEERRKEKHRKMEEEREKMRQEIRDKYGIKKKESLVDDLSLDVGRLGRKGKGQVCESASSPSSVSGSCTSPSSDTARGFPRSLDDLTATVKELPERMMSTVTDASDKCKMQ